MTLYAYVREEGGGNTSFTLDSGDLVTATAEAQRLAENWILDGGTDAYGAEGARVDVWGHVEDEEGEELASFAFDVKIEPDHDALIEAAGGDTDCDHRWVATYDIEGGLTENPGVQSVGGTAFDITDHCDRCGLGRHQHHTGSQRNTGESDTVTYTAPETVYSGCHHCDGEPCKCGDCGASHVWQGYAAERDETSHGCQGCGQYTCGQHAYDYGLCPDCSEPEDDEED